MVCGDGHAPGEIETVGIEALNAGIEVELRAAFLASALDQPLEEGLAVTLGTQSCIRHEIVHVAVEAPDEVLSEAETGDGGDVRINLYEREPVTRGLLVLNASDEIRLGDMRPKLAHDGIAIRDGFGCFCEGDAEVRVDHLPFVSATRARASLHVRVSFLTTTTLSPG